MNQLFKVKLDPRLLARHSLPDADYWLSAADAPPIEPEGPLPAQALLAGAQQRSSEDPAGWHSLEPAMARLSAILAVNGPARGLTLRADGWSLQLGSVDLSSMIVTIQRNDVLIAAIARGHGGGLLVTTFRPLDADSCLRLMALGATPAADGTVCMRPDNWEYALDSSVGMGNIYCADRGASYLSFWEFGLGIARGGALVADWREQRSAVPRPASLTQADLLAYCAAHPAT